MSRTDKHRPGWVQASEHGTEQSHRHELFGAPVIVQRRVRDARGRITKIDAPERISIQRALAMWVPPSADASYRARAAAATRQARRLRSAGAALTELVDGPRIITRTRTRDVVIGHYATHCTVQDDYDRDGRLRGRPRVYAPCQRELDFEDARTTWGRSRGSRAYGEYRDHRAPTRRAQANDNRQRTVLADSGSDPDNDPGLGDPAP